MSLDNFEEIKKTILDINEVVAKVDPVIKQAVFDILVGKFINKSKAGASKVDSVLADESKEKNVDTHDLGAFITSFDTKKPAEALMVLAAWLYSQYGVYAITPKDLKELADSCGLTIPTRPDVTLRQAKASGKNKFVQQGKGWKLTVTGELAMKESYGVTKGTKPLPEE